MEGAFLLVDFLPFQQFVNQTKVEKVEKLFYFQLILKIREGVKLKTDQNWLKPEWQVFINEFMASNDHIAAYQAAYPGVNRKSAATKGKKLLQHETIKYVIDQRGQRKATLINEATDKEIIEAAKGRVLSESEVDAMLCDIIAGRLELFKPIVVQGRIVKVATVPNYQDRIQAAAQYYKRFGSYAPTQNQQLGADGKPVNPSTPAPVFILNMPDGININFPSNTDGE